MTEEEQIKNLMNVENNIQRACERVGRKREEVTLIAVSKTNPVEVLTPIYHAGIREFGENKVQELEEKYQKMEKDIHWHMIGHLQRNKVRQVLKRACMIHSLDSQKLADSIEQEAANFDLCVPVLIEVNVAKEKSKFGIFPEEVEMFVRKLSDYPHIKVKGLMTIAPYVENPEENREIFQKLRKLSVDIKKKNSHNVNMEYLSMGMTNDYEIAIEEGATHIRVGTGIFGEREYKRS